MATTTSQLSRRTLRARVAALSRSRTPDDPEYLETRRALRAAALEDAVRQAVDAAPPLTAEQRDRIASILWAPSADGGAPDAA